MADIPLLRLEGITKRYGSLIANDGVSLTLDAGEVMGILGENGAGKSTLMNVISGLIRPDGGTMQLNGQALVLSSPREAAEAGIGMVHQHFKLVGALTVAENLALGDPRWGRRMLLGFGGLRAEIGVLAKSLGVDVDFDVRVDRLTVGQQQRVEIMKVLSRKPRLLILDEPTAVLSQEERPALFRMVAGLAAQGTAVIIISHKLEDILESCRRVVVMRHGKVVNNSDVRGKSREDLIRLLVGDEMPVLAEKSGAVQSGQSLLKTAGLTIKRPNGTVALHEATFEVRRGEILALCGVEGNGQSELVRAVTGLLKPDAGRLDYWFGEGGDYLDAAALRRQGVCHIPEDRLKDGVLPDASLGDNFLLTHLGCAQFNRLGWLRPKQVETAVEEAVRDYAIKTPSLQAAMSQLSGGNQQKLVLARELASHPSLIVAAHPTRGLDVKTIAFINNQLLERRATGAGVLLASADLAEVWPIADRIMVLSAGRLHGPVAVSETTLQEVGRWMTQR
ncbi:ABC transporter ATP-binding protein [Pusillimonas sp. CC-YST705]|uniref:ABC transporter ATP-binding protein n=1 Tax=Mesopusillimonas faecipullorum TaxID=2755040 RepID=A0ABS8CFR4_9BURK|nr:ABC transporter ATP-binding protein [Mesopusillimonas faecipullorum]MCB5364880.1 ABC transporter ATP-binding protein [Mesopusillimonas faecipullorum]